MIIMIILIALKGASQDCLQSPQCAVNCLQHVHSIGQGAIVCKSCAKYQVLITCNRACATCYEGTARLLDLTDLVYWLKQSTDQGEEETGAPRVNS